MRSQPAEALLLAALLGIGSGCVRPVEITYRGHLIQGQWPSTTQSFRRPMQAPPPPDYYAGPFLVAVVSAGTDLADLASRMQAHHLGYRLAACVAPDTEAALLGGPVFDATESDREQLQIETRAGEHLYKVYVPMALRSAIERAPYEVNRDVAAGLQAASTGGLCVTLGATVVLGRELRSNAEKLPVDLVGNSLQVRGGTSAPRVLQSRQPAQFAGRE